MLSIDVIMTLKIENIICFETPPQSCGVERLLDDECLAQKYLTLSLKFLARQIHQTIILGPKNPRGRTIILGQRELTTCCFVIPDEF